MQPDFWHNKWERNEIGFHQDSINRYLRDHWSILGLNGNEVVFVPLCGKSLDMHWINRLGHPVVGVELNASACRQFFAEAGMEARISRQGRFEVYQAGTITLLCGDVFELNTEHMTGVRAVYDRAALIALPSDLRQRYVRHLRAILPPEAQILLVTMTYPEHPVSSPQMGASSVGQPPFSVSENDVRCLFAEHYSIELIHRNELGWDDPFAKRKGLSDLWETVYRLSLNTPDVLTRDACPTET
jgi:thiopurine S-methyltransferase